jgi:hypothetical protein
MRPPYGDVEENPLLIAEKNRVRDQETRSVEVPRSNAESTVAKLLRISGGCHARACS